MAGNLRRHYAHKWVTYLSINLAQCTVTLLMRPMPLLIVQTTAQLNNGTCDKTVIDSQWYFVLVQ